MKKILLIISLLCAAMLTASQEVEKIQNDINRRVEKNGKSFDIVVGIISESGRTIIHTGTADGDSIFNLCSVAKLFTATLLAEMVERGELNLDDPIEKYLPKGVKLPAASGGKITLRHLATHTSGLPSIPGNTAPRPDNRPGYVDYTPELLYRFLASYTPAWQSGKHFEYSNLGMGLLGHLLSLKAGKSLESLFHERIFKPLQMTETGLRNTLEQSPGMRRHLTVGHYNSGQETPYWPLAPVLQGAGGFYSTVNDMLNFLAANLGFIKAPPLLAAALHKTQELHFDSGTGHQVGLGWGMDKKEGSHFLFHSGGVDGYNSMIGLDRIQRRGVVILANSSVNIYDLGAIILDKRLQDIIKPVTEPLAESRRLESLPPEILATYSGRYRLGEHGMVLVNREGSRLFLQVQGQSQVEIFPSAEAEFFSLKPEARVRFIKDENGKVSGIIIRQEELEITCMRMKDLTAAAVDPEILKAYVGQFEITPDLKVIITSEDNQLFLQATRKPCLPMVPISETRFISPMEDMEVIFRPDAKGMVDGLEILWEGNRLEGRRVKEQETLKLETALLDEYVGEYRVTPRFSLTITREGDRLFVQGTAQPRFEIFPEARDAFFIKAVNAKITFLRDEKGKVIRSVVHADGSQEVGEKIN